RRPPPSHPLAPAPTIPIRVPMTPPRSLVRVSTSWFPAVRGSPTRSGPVRPSTWRPVPSGDARGGGRLIVSGPAPPPPATRGPRSHRRVHGQGRRGREAAPTRRPGGRALHHR